MKDPIKELLHTIKDAIVKYELKQEETDWPKFKVGSRVVYIENNEIKEGFIYSATIYGGDTHYSITDNKHPIGNGRDNEITKREFQLARPKYNM